MLAIEEDDGAIDRSIRFIIVGIVFDVVGLVLLGLQFASWVFPIGFSDLPYEWPLLLIGLGIICLVMSASNVENKILKRGGRFEMRIESAAIINTAIIAFAVVFGIFTTIPRDLEVDPEYINGILAASSILFGFWILFLGRTLESRTRKAKFISSGWIGFYISFSLLITSAVCAYLSALKVMSSSLTLTVCTVSFPENSTFVWLEIDSYFTHKALGQKT